MDTTVLSAGGGSEAVMLHQTLTRFACDMQARYQAPNSRVNSGCVETLTRLSRPVEVHRRFNVADELKHAAVAAIGEVRYCHVVFVCISCYFMDM